MPVGPSYYADGVTPTSGRYGKTNEAVVSQAHGKYYEAASRGKVFAACDIVGVAIQTSVTTTGNLTLHNLPGSQKRLAILKVSAAYFSGTITAGALYHGFNAVGIVQPSSGTDLTARCTDIGCQSNASPVGVAKTGATVVAGVGLWPFASALPILATTANNPFTIVEDLDGVIVLEPGASYQVLAVMGGSGSTPKFSFGIIWEEIPIVADNG